MAETKTDHHINGTNVTATEKNYTAPARLWKRLQITEWMFIFLLFVISLSTVLGKFYINYGTILQPLSNSKSVVSLTPVSLNISIIVDVLRMPDVSEFCTKHLTATYGWLIKAAISGLIMMSFTWFIIYKDSSIPGIDPPAPFSPSKHRFATKTIIIQINYLVGLLNGILIFIYMCL